ncbi:hypothetical protein [Mycobacterium sp. PSTR-4-N]|uniref:VG15 protein n=1 Tax=Mycobacterium sp. PSTR-4-N TaxID=2917745 RepID=UPI001F154924|nr:hypothetical protein [Mycobacterium sp. PSTR-4-N]MCG7592393.1 hypothetical protein [Mycobacterium sp. PSTR-4-N]
MTAPQAASAAGVAGGLIVAANTTDLVVQAEALQQILGDLAAVTVQQVVQFFAQYNSAHPEFPTLLRQVFPRILEQNGQAAAAIAARWYDELKPDSDFTATPVVDIPPAQLDKTINWALYAPGKATPVDRLSGSAKRLVTNAARDTLTDNANTEGVRWARYASATACAFCRLLATRGPVYHSEQSAKFVVGREKQMTRAERRQRAAARMAGLPDPARRVEYTGQTRGTRALGEKYHDHCRCIPVPVRSGDYEPPDYVQRWEDDYIAAVKATQSAGKTKGEYGAIDINAVLAHMRSNSDAH